MSGLSSKQTKALFQVVSATIAAVAAAGAQGAPGGVLYAGMMQQGCTLNQFQSLMAALVTAGRITQDGDLYFVVQA